MTDTDQTQADESVKQDQEPTKSVDPAQAAGQQAAKDYKPTPDPKSKDSFSPEEVERMTSKAVNEYREKMEKELKAKQEKGDYMTRDEFNAALAEERERFKVAQQAQEFFVRELAGMGITPGTEAYDKVAKTYAELEEQGAITPKALSSQAGIKALAFTAGVLEAKTEASRDRYIDLTHNARFKGVDPAEIPDYAKTDIAVDDAVTEALRKIGR